MDRMTHTGATTNPPRRRGLPYVGSTLAYVRDPLSMMREQYDRYGPVSEIDFIGKRWTVLLGPDACPIPLRNADKAYSSGEGWGYLVGPFFDRGLMLLDFEEHHRHRRIMQSAFTRDHLERYTDALQQAVASGLDAWQPDDDFRAYPALKELTLGLAATVFMGGADLASADELSRVNKAFIDCVQSATSLVRINVPGTRWGKAIRGRALLEEFFRRHLPGKRANPGTDLFSVLCQVTTEDGERFSDDDIVNHMIFLMMAAHDTSTITTAAVAYFLAKNPEWQDRVRAESDGLGDELPGIEDLEGLTTMDMVIKESLRLVAPVPLVMRKTVADTVIDGYFDVVQQFDDYYDDVSAGLFADEPLSAEQQRNWFQMRRALVRFHRLVVPMRETAPLMSDCSALRSKTSYFNDELPLLMTRTFMLDPLAGVGLRVLCSKDRGRGLPCFPYENDFQKV